MNPYFDTNHLAGALLLVAVAGLGRDGTRPLLDKAVREPPRSAARLAAGLLAVPDRRERRALPGPRIVPAAAIRPGAVAFAIGLVILLAGLVLRGWSIKTLGTYFTASVKVSPDQPVITAGPYRVLRHPSYTGLLLAMTGVGLASANWAGLIGMAASPAGRAPVAHPRRGETRCWPRSATRTAPTPRTTSASSRSSGDQAMTATDVAGPADPTARQARPQNNQLATGGGNDGFAGGEGNHRYRRRLGDR